MAKKKLLEVIYLHKDDGPPQVFGIYRHAELPDAFKGGYLYVDNGDMIPEQVYRIIGSHRDPVTHHTIIELAKGDKLDPNRNAAKRVTAPGGVPNPT